ncbi:metal-sulfur cluster assembly factor [Magnetospirillum sulfuroxidans]|uniref:Metal-sulfur cluster assembly factor n=1 Tax=Magnetospirillum sulfuroxidans TaxID=611300 RepID=A0ABS5IAE0_9PROT|nr:metal-sulfur cluster assembly factor [Magnetospirillum sulfuroxidans]MBR9971383.1 metal-sulfur cluster assembly factor [Magnetospirillum sulfuroxidans]
MNPLLETLKQIIDPDIGVNIVDLGLVESVSDSEGAIRIALIMTTPACPQSGYLRDEAKRLIPGAQVEILEHPLWQPERMSAAAKAILGWP